MEFETDSKSIEEKWKAREEKWREEKTEKEKSWKEEWSKREETFENDWEKRESNLREEMKREIEHGISKREAEFKRKEADMRRKLDDEIKDHEEEYQEIKTKLDEQIEITKNEIEKNAKLEEKMKDKLKEVEEHLQELLKQERTNHSEDNAKHEEAWRERELKFDQEWGEREKMMNEKYEAEVEKSVSLKKRHEVDIELWKETCENYQKQLKESEAEHEKALESNQTEQNKLLEQVRTLTDMNDSNRSINQLDKQHQAEKDEMFQRYEADKEDWQRKHREQGEQHATTQEAWETREKELIAKHQEDLQKLRFELQKDDSSLLSGGGDTARTNNTNVLAEGGAPRQVPSPLPASAAPTVDSDYNKTRIASETAALQQQILELEQQNEDHEKRYQESLQQHQDAWDAREINYDQEWEARERYLNEKHDEAMRKLRSLSKEKAEKAEALNPEVAGSVAGNTSARQNQDQSPLWVGSQEQKNSLEEWLRKEQEWKLKEEEYKKETAHHKHAWEERERGHEVWQKLRRLPEVDRSFNLSLTRTRWEFKNMNTKLHGLRHLLYTKLHGFQVFTV